MTFSRRSKHIIEDKINIKITTSMNSIEFYSLGTEIVYKTDESITVLTETESGVINRMYDIIEKDYPEALMRLQELYGKVGFNQRYRRFRMMKRFCLCNFGTEDNKNDITKSGRFNFEHVPCPRRGECRDENIICKPKFKSRITPSEYRVIEAFVSGNYSKEQIADKLIIAPSTVNNHIAAVYKRLNITSKGELVAYWKDNNLGISKN